MEPQHPLGRLIEFGPFQADLQSGELLKNGRKIRLSEQPFRLLTILLERPGEVVSRDELRRRMWPEETHVDFDRSLNTAASKLREALGDNAERCCYIQTFPKRGYRFSAPVNGGYHKSSANGIAPAIPAPQPPRRTRSVSLPWVAIAASAVVLLSAFLYWRSFVPAPVIKRYLRLTNDEFSKSPELATDGPRLFFSAWKGGRGVLAEVSTTGGETQLLSTPSMGSDTNVCIRGISPDKQNLLVVTGKQRNILPGYALWKLRASTLTGGTVGEVIANDADWSPDAKHICYATKDQIWVADPSGGNRRKIAETGGLTGYARWSPDGKRIRFTSLAWDTYEQTIWEVAAEGGAAHALFPDLKAEQWGGRWTPDARFYVFNSESNIWIVDETNGWFRRGRVPIQLTFGPLSFLAPLAAPDNTRLYAVGEIRRGELLRYDQSKTLFKPIFPGLSADSVVFSPDQQWIAYITYPKAELWRSRVDGSDKQQLTSAPMKANRASWSPDGTRISFSAKMPGSVWKAYAVAANGGSAEAFAPNLRITDPSWSPEGGRIAVTDRDQRMSIAILDMRTHQLSPVPGSEGMGQPYWSPDGLYIAASRESDLACMLFNIQRQEWLELSSSSCGWVNWARDSRSFISLEGKGVSVQRFDTIRRSFTRLVSLADYRITGNHLAWLGIAPDDSPLILREAGSQEIYALEWSTQ